MNFVKLSNSKNSYVFINLDAVEAINRRMNDEWTYITLGGEDNCWKVLETPEEIFSKPRCTLRGDD